MISDIDPTTPVDDDNKSDLDTQITAFKSDVLDTLPTINVAVLADGEHLNQVTNNNFIDTIYEDAAEIVKLSGARFTGSVINADGSDPQFDNQLVTKAWVDVVIAAAFGTDPPVAGCTVPISIVDTIVNPSAETSAMEGWVIDSGSPIDRELNSGPPVESGSYVFYGGDPPGSGYYETYVREELKHDLIASGLTGFGIDAGLYYVALKYWADTFDVQEDTGRFGIQFYDKNKAELSTAWGDERNNDSWVHFEDSHLIPVGARYLSIVITCIRRQGVQSSIFWDLLELEYYGSSDGACNIVMPLLNPGAEDGMAHWGNTGQWDIGSTGSFVDPYEGSKHFAGGETGGTGDFGNSNSDEMELAASGIDLAEVDTGNTRMTIEYQQSSGFGVDSGRCGLRFLDVDHTEVGRTLDTNRAISPANVWVSRSMTLSVPIGTRYVQAVIGMFINDGTYCQCCIDAIKVTFLRSPA